MKSKIKNVIPFVLILWLVIFIANSGYAAETYTLQAGDTLWDLSSKFYGDPTLYPVFMEVNDITNVRSLPSGSEILVPSYDELKKIAAETDPEKKKELINKAKSSAGASKKDNEQPPKELPKEYADQTASPPAEIDPDKATMKNILEGPQGSPEELKTVNSFDRRTP